MDVTPREVGFTYELSTEGGGMISGRQVCTKLVLDSADPTVRFDENGVSGQYHDFHRRVLPLWNPTPDGSQELHILADKIRAEGKGRDFDCILGMSGGADSSYMLHKMVTQYGLRPLVFHVDAGWNTELAVHNINCVVEGLGVDLFTEVINWEEVRDFQVAMFQSGTPYLDAPQDIAFISVLYRYARKFGIKYILNGGNISTECVGYPEHIYYFPDMTMIRAILNRFCDSKLTAYPFSTSFDRLVAAPVLHGIRRLKPLNSMRYVKSEAMAELERVYGWKPYPQKHFESRFTRFFESYWLPTRFDYDVRRVQFSSLILTGQMTREEALAELGKSPFSTEDARNDYAFISSKLGISEDELHRYHSQPIKYFWDYPNSHRWYRFGEKVMALLTGTRRGGAY